MKQHRPPLSRSEIVLAILLIGMFYAAWNPFQFSPPNRVEWLLDEPGLQFQAGAIAHSRLPLAWGETEDDRAISVELWIEPEVKSKYRLAHILSLYDGEEAPPLVIAKWKSALVLRSRLEPQPGEWSYWEIGAKDALPAGQRRFITVTSAPAQGTSVYVDGAPLTRHWKRSIIPPGGGFGGRLLLGCSQRGGGAFHGALYGVAIYDRALSPEEVAEHVQWVQTRGMRSLGAAPGLRALYPLDEGQGQEAFDAASLDNLIQLPDTFKPLRRDVLGFASSRDRMRNWYLVDVLWNLAGFIPFGFFGSVALQRRFQLRASMLTFSATALGAVISLLIELVQVQLPSRYSTVSDLLYNILGALIGALIARVFLAMEARALETGLDSKLY